MAVADYKGLVESIYVSYFGRPADTLGLANFAAQLDALKAPTTVFGLNASYKSTPALRSLIDSFGASAESINLYGSDNVAFVSAIYQNLLNRTADFDGLVFWVTELNAGRLTKGNAALAIMAGAYENKSAQGLLDAKLLDNKVAIATNFTTAVDTADELNAYRGDAAAATARDMLKTVTATTSTTAFQATVDATLATIVTNAIPVVITSLTTGIDAFNGTAGNDNFRAIVGTGATLTAFDSIDGGAGNNSLTVFDLDTTGATATSLPNASITYKNIQTLNVQTANTLGANIDGTQIGSLSALNVVTSVGPVTVKASGTTAVKVNDVNGPVSVTGGSTVDVTTSTAAGSTVSVTSVAGKTSLVSIHGGNGVTINDVATGTVADTIATVSLDGTSGATTIASDVLTSLNLTKSNGGVTVTAAAGTRALNVALNGQTGGTITDATATTVNVAALTVASTGVSLAAAAATSVNLAAGVATTITSLNADAATSVTLSGSGKITVGAASLAALTSIDAAATTGGVAITPALGTGVAFTGGTGADTISIGATTKAVALGDGNDSVTLTAGALGTGGSVDGGAGVDSLTGTSALMSAQLASAATAAKITGFETIRVSDVLAAASSFDVSALVGAVNFTAANGVATGGTATVTGLGAGANVSILGAAANNGTLDLSMKTDTAADVLNVTVNHNFTNGNTSAVNAFTTNLSAASVETLNVTSTATSTGATANATVDSVNNTLVISDAALVTLNLSGSQAVSFTSSAASTKLATIDASTDTAGATINASAAVAGLTIKGSATAANTLTGSASVDTIIGGNKADVIAGGIGGDTLTGNGGNDTFVIANGDSTITLGKADTITDFVANTYGVGTDGAVNAFGATGVAAAKLTGDVIQLTHGFNVGTGATVTSAVTVGVYTNASDATTFLATASATESATAQTIHAALNSTTGDLYIDIDGNGVADLYVHLTGVQTLTAAAFLIA